MLPPTMTMMEVAWTTSRHAFHLIIAWWNARFNKK